MVGGRFRHGGRVFSSSRRQLISNGSMIEVLGECMLRVSCDCDDLKRFERSLLL